MTDSDDVLDALEAYVAENPEPFATAPDLADSVDATRRHVLDLLRLLEAGGRVESRKVGRARVFWPVPPAEPSAEPATEPPAESTQFPPEETAPSRDSPPAEPPAERGQIAEVEFPGSQDRADCLAVIEAAREYLEEHGGATKREVVRDVMPEHPLGYDVPALEEGERFRGAWWRRIVKPGLEALEDVEKPPRGGSKWRYSG